MAIEKIGSQATIQNQPPSAVSWKGKFRQIVKDAIVPAFLKSTATKIGGLFAACILAPFTLTAALAAGISYGIASLRDWVCLSSPAKKDDSEPESYNSSYSKTQEPQELIDWADYGSQGSRNSLI